MFKIFEITRKFPNIPKKIGKKVPSFFTNKNLAAYELCYPLSTSLAYRRLNRRVFLGRLKLILGVLPW